MEDRNPEGGVKVTKTQSILPWNNEELEKVLREHIAHFVPLGMTRTRKRFGVLAKWKPTMCQRGARAALLRQRIAKCCAKHTIGQKVIGKNLERLNEI